MDVTKKAMELREIIFLYWAQRRLFALIVVASIFIALVWQVNQPVKYRAALLLNIGRKGAQETSEYTYDSFYRLQADERFADTVVRWLQSPRVVSDILKESGLGTSAYSERALTKMIGAKRLSSQVIELSFGLPSKSALEKESDAIVKVVNEYTSGLNQERQADGWFVVVGSDPVVSDARVSLQTAVFVGAAAGVFMAFWLVALHHTLAVPVAGRKETEKKLTEESL